ncbi:MAG: hypothetical protein AAF206_03465 [Bacteroidota bacterium]
MKFRHLIILVCLLLPATLLAQSSKSTWLRVNVYMALQSGIEGERILSTHAFRPTIIFEKKRLRHQIIFNNFSHTREVSENRRSNSFGISNGYQLDYVFQSPDRSWAPYIGGALNISFTKWRGTSLRRASIHDGLSIWTRVDLILGLQFDLNDRLRLFTELFSDMYHLDVSRDIFRNEMPFRETRASNVSDDWFNWKETTGLQIGLGLRI